MKPEKYAKKKARRLQDRFEALPRSVALRVAGHETARSATGIRQATDAELRRAARFGKALATDQSLDHEDAIKDFHERVEAAVEVPSNRTGASKTWQ